MENLDFTPYPEALELKELGFDEPCIGFYKLGDVDIYYDTIIQGKSHKFRNNTGLNIYGDLKEKIAAPTYSQAFRFFREKHGLLVDFINSAHLNFGKYIAITIKNGELETKYEGVFKNHEEAEFACLKELIEIVKEGKK